MNYIKSFAFITIFSLVTVYYFSLNCLLKAYYYIWNKRFTKSNYHLLATGWAQSFFNLIPGWRLTINGRHNIPKRKKSYIIIANHESAVDILAIYFLNIQFRWLAKKESFQVPLIGQIMSRAGYIPIERGSKKSHQQALQSCTEALQTNMPVLFFPEGTRSTFGYPKAFKIGAFKLAKECRIPILPIVIKGSGHLLKKGSLAPNKGHVQLSILPLIDSEDNESILEYTERVQKLIVKKHATMTTKDT